ncbi:hypothetical protein [Lysinibacillus telephonicus]|uniref:hypothetical protein n=1 Tax=Lysinibacillus telephonicus TaxID=1714840 RepID=UPI003BA222D1
MKKIQIIMLLLIMGVSIGACSDEADPHLTRVDIQKIDEDEMYKEEVILVDLITLDSLKSIFNEVKWKPNSSKEMSAKEDLQLTLFFTYEENMSEKLFLYRIWFEDDDEVIIISNNEEEGYGKLEGDNAVKLKNILIGQFLEEEME